MDMSKSASPPGVLSFFPRVHNDSSAEDSEVYLDPFDQPQVIEDVALKLNYDLLNRDGIVPVYFVKLWMAELLLILERLHAENFMCRTLSPKNVLLTDTGHVLLTFFSEWPCIDLSAGDDLYLAPELISGGSNNANPLSDYWTFGATLFELIVGVPYLLYHPWGSSGQALLEFPSELRVAVEARDILRKLLCPDPLTRLGSSPNGVEDIKAHPFFMGVNWHDLLQMVQRF